MGYATIFEKPEQSFLWGELSFSIVIVAVALLYLLACGYQIYQKRRLGSKQVIVAALLILIGTFSGSVLIDFAQNGIQDPNVKAYYAGEYELAEGKIRGFRETKEGYIFSIDGQEFFYKGTPAEESQNAKVYYIDEGEGTYDVMRIDVEQR